MSDQTKILKAELKGLRDLKGGDLIKFEDFWYQGAWGCLGGLFLNTILADFFA
jgi:hypothetical protein